jgi:hypothetical protein
MGLKEKNGTWRDIVVEPSQCKEEDAVTKYVVVALFLAGLSSANAAAPKSSGEAAPGCYLACVKRTADDCAQTKEVCPKAAATPAAEKKPAKAKADKKPKADAKPKAEKS